MKTLKIAMECSAIYISELEVPENYTLKEAIEYAKNNNERIKVSDLEWLEDTELDVSNCYFK